MKTPTFFLSFLMLLFCLFSCGKSQEELQNAPASGVPLGEQCFEYKGESKRIYVRLLVDDSVVTGKYKEYIRDDIRAEYFTKSSSFRAVRQKEGLDVFLTNESGIKSRAIWYLYPNQLNTGSFKCIPIECVESTEVREKHVSEVRNYTSIINNHLRNLAKKEKKYESVSQSLEGKVTAYYKNIHPLKLVDEHASPQGKILTEFYFSEKKELLAVSKTEWRKASEKMQEIRHEDLFFKDKKLIAVLEKFTMQKAQESTNLSQVIASDITENIGSTLASKSKRNLEEAFALVGFVSTKKNYDEFFNH